MILIYFQAFRWRQIKAKLDNLVLNCWVWNLEVEKNVNKGISFRGSAKYEKWSDYILASSFPLSHIKVGAGTN